MSRVRALIAGSLAEARASAIAARAMTTDHAHAATRGARFGWGAALPIALLRALLADPALRATYLRIKLRQLGAVVATSALLIWVFAIDKHLRQGQTLPGRLAEGAALASSVYAILCFSEWASIALTRQYDDYLGALVAEKLRIPGEGSLLPPRLTLDVRWLVRKARRRVRGLWVFLAGAPILLLAGGVPLLGPGLYAVLAAAWAFFWLAVFTAANTATGWTEEGVAYDPWFVRVLLRFAAWLPRPLAAPVRGYLRLARFMTRAMTSPCAAVERASWELAGVAACRTMLGIPGLYLFLRPFVPVAAAYVNLTRLPLVTAGEPPPHGTR